MKKIIVQALLLITSPIFGLNNFELSSKSITSKSITFTAPELKTDTKNGYSRLTFAEKGSTTDDGMPELPIFTSFFR